MSDFTTTSRPTMLALRLCAARLDPQVSHEAFAQLVADFREAVEKPIVTVEQQRMMRELGGTVTRGGPVARASGAEPQGDQNARDSSTGAAAARPKAAQPTNPDDVARASPAAPSTSSAPPAAEPVVAAPSQEAGGARITEQEKLAIKADYLAEIGDTHRAPNGVFDRLGEKYGRSAAAVKKIVARFKLGARKSVDKRPAASAPDAEAPDATEREPLDELLPSPPSDPEPPAQRRRFDHTVPPDADVSLEHTNSNACWCRKGANKAGNYWCPNKPSDGKFRSLAGLQDAPRRRDRYLSGRAE